MLLDLFVISVNADDEVVDEDEDEDEGAEELLA